MTYSITSEQIQAVVNEAKKLLRNGQPVLHQTIGLNNTFSLAKLYGTEEGPVLLPPVPLHHEPLDLEDREPYTTIARELNIPLL